MGKTKISDEFVKTTELHRKAAIRLLNWEAEDRLCSKRLQDDMEFRRQNRHSILGIG